MAIPLGYSSLTSASDHVSAVERFLVIAGAAAAVVATGCVLKDCKTVLVSGPVLFVIGLGLTWIGWRARRRWTLLSGVAHCGICLLFFSLVCGFNWGPSEARDPFAMMGAVYSAAAVALGGDQSVGSQTSRFSLMREFSCHSDVRKTWCDALRVRTRTFIGTIAAKALTGRSCSKAVIDAVRCSRVFSRDSSDPGKS